MPFYLAIPRKGNTAPQRRQATERVDYLRSPPSEVNYIDINPHSRNLGYLMDNLHAVAASAYAGRAAGSFCVSVSPDVPVMPIFQQEEDPVELPWPKLSLKLGEDDEEAKEKLEELGFEMRNLKEKGTIHVGFLDDLSRLDGLPLVIRHDPMGQTVSLHGLNSFIMLGKICSLAIKTINLVLKNTESSTGVRLLEYGSYEKMQIMETVVSNPAPAKKEEKSVNKGRVMNLSTGIIAMEALDDDILFDENIDDVSSTGIFVPFEPNYSDIDKRAAAKFVSDFICIISEIGRIGIVEDELVEAWTSEIAACPEGEFMAHLMSCIMLAKKVFARIHVLIREGTYEGCILSGAKEFYLKVVGGKAVKSMSIAQVKDDIDRYAFHSTTLAEIGKEMGLDDSEVKKIKSMRMLRKAILGKNEFSMPITKRTWLKKKLFYLNFREKPENANVTTLQRFMSYINPISPIPIPDNVYLDRAAFFSINDTEVALSMFGSFPPSPNGSGRAYIVAVSPSSDKKISQDPAKVQFKFKGLSDAASDWENFLKGGIVSWRDGKEKRTRAFTGQEAKQLWGGLKQLGSAAFSARISDNKGKGKEKRKRDDDNEEDDTQRVPVGKKAFKFNFSSFGTPMDTDR